MRAWRTADRAAVAELIRKTSIIGWEDLLWRGTVLIHAERLHAQSRRLGCMARDIIEGARGIKS